MNRNTLINTIKKYSFLFEELVSRDFKQKYKRTILGMAWSVLSPLFNLLVLSVVFNRMFGKDTPHYTIYLFCGTLVMTYFRESTREGMKTLMRNSDVITKINIPKYMFLLSNNVSSLINFLLTLMVFILFCIIDNIQFGWHFLLIIFLIITLCIFNIGIGLILSALYVFFRDIGYLYDIFLTLLNYLSAVFYRVDIFPRNEQMLFLLNPIYCYIYFFRTVVIDGIIPPVYLFVLCFLYSFLSLCIGLRIYKKYNHQFLYYM